MNLSRSSILILLLVALGLVLFQQGAPQARSAESGATATVVPANAGEAAVPAPKKSGGVVDAKTVFFGCAAGTTVGALAVALPPMVGWTFYAGALPAVMAMLVTSGVGCTVGLFGGVIISTFSWLFDKIGGAWHAVFG